jgi:hypothetical protein
VTNFLSNGQQIALLRMKENTRFFSRSNCERGPICGMNPIFKCKDILTWSVSVWESKGGTPKTPKFNFHQTLSKLNLFILLEFFWKIHNWSYLHLQFKYWKHKLWTFERSRIKVPKSFPTIKISNVNGSLQFQFESLMYCLFKGYNVSFKKIQIKFKWTFKEGSKEPLEWSRNFFQESNILVSFV